MLLLYIQENLMQDIEKRKRGEYVSFFYESDPGRPRKAETDKRKLRSIRISDNEFKKMGTTSTAEIRERAINWNQLMKLIDYMEKEGHLSIPDELLDVDMNDPFWKNSLRTASDKMKYLISNNVINFSDE